jgi:hypothetical protein
VQFPTMLQDAAGKIRVKAQQSRGLERMRLESLADSLAAEARVQQSTLTAPAPVTLASLRIA